MSTGFSVTWEGHALPGQNNSRLTTWGSRRQMTSHLLGRIAGALWAARKKCGWCMAEAWFNHLKNPSIVSFEYVKNKSLGFFGGQTHMKA
jgi:hypothetical protein